MKKWILVAAATLLAGPALAENDNLLGVKTFGSLSYQYTFADGDRPTDDGRGVHLSIGHFLTQHIAVEIAGDYSRFKADEVIGRDGRAYNVKLGANYVFMPERLFNPYIGIGGGLANNQLRDPNDRRRRGFGEATLGVMSNFLGLRTELAYRYTDGIPGHPAGTAISSAEELIVRAGFIMPLWRAPQPEAPPPAPVEEAVVDSDGDGVPDHLDECPGTPAGVRVDARGCPLDSDGDGVPDYLDKCPNTPAGVEVDETGCPVVARIDRKFEDVNFGFDRHDLTTYGRSNLDKTAEEIQGLAQRNPGLRVRVEGHTDSVGPAEYNMQLGERRAQTVRDYLVTRGVDAQRIETSSAGETRPVSSNDTARGRLLNRRVEIRAAAQ